jgi:hypothetical protein
MVIWLMMGWRFEETQSTEPMGAEQCIELLFRVERDRSPAFQSAAASPKASAFPKMGS